jgi:hypothetical protein
MLIDAYSSLSHYSAHLRPIWAELERLGIAGDYFTAKATDGGLPMTGEAQSRKDRPVMVASYTDAQHWRSRAVIYVEHGAGQTYGGSDARDDRNASLSGSYSGGVGLGNVSLFICPSQTVADRWTARYPTAQTAAVGCPKLDRFHLMERIDPGIWTVAIAFHWDLGLCPETRWAVPHYGTRLQDLRRVVEGLGGRLIGHGHPRDTRAFGELYGRHSIEYWASSDRVLSEAHCLIVDNSSLGYEFASLGRPTIWMNAPWYRKDVHHGLRFWDLIPGPQVDDMDQLLTEITVRREQPDHVAARDRVMPQVYAYTDGKASLRAAEAIRDAF